MDLSGDRLATNDVTSDSGFEASSSCAAKLGERSVYHGKMDDQVLRNNDCEFVDTGCASGIVRDSSRASAFILVRSVILPERYLPAQRTCDLKGDDVWDILSAAE